MFLVGISVQEIVDKDKKNMVIFLSPWGRKIYKKWFPSPAVSGRTEKVGI